MCSSLAVSEERPEGELSIDGPVCACTALQQSRSLLDATSLQTNVHCDAITRRSYRRRTARRSASRIMCRKQRRTFGVINFGRSNHTTLVTVGVPNSRPSSAFGTRLQRKVRLYLEIYSNFFTTQCEISRGYRLFAEEQPDPFRRLDRIPACGGQTPGAGIYCAEHTV